MIIINELADQTHILAWAEMSTKLFSFGPEHLMSNPAYLDSFYSFLHPLSTNQPLFYLLVSILGSFFSANVYVVFTLITTILNLGISYLFFKRFKYGGFYAFLYSFSTYFFSHYGIHMELTQVWVLPLFLVILENKNIENIYKKGLYLALVLVFTTLISNYLGFILLTFLGLYAFWEVIINYVQKQPVINSIKMYFVTFGITLLALLLFLGPYIRVNYLHQDEYVRPYTGYSIRPYEDFFTFSSRPWYFLIPPERNPLLGKYNNYFVEKFKQSNYFLADDYSPTEHEGNYFGVALLLLFGIAVTIGIKESNQTTKIKTYHLIIVGGCLFLLMLPPFFTISGFKVYTPGWISYKLFPMFRVTARLSVILHLIILYITAMNIGYLIKNNLRTSKFLSLVAPALLIISLVETYIPFEIKVYNEPHAAYTYIKETTPITSKIAFYPYGITNEAFLFNSYYQRSLVNLRWYESSTFSSETFTRGLTTAEGILGLRTYNIDYLVVGKNANQHDIDFFNNSYLLHKETETSEHIIYSVTKPYLSDLNLIPKLLQ